MVTKVPHEDQHPWIQKSFTDGAIMAENLITVQKNKKEKIANNCHSANHSVFRYMAEKILMSFKFH